MAAGRNGSVVAADVLDDATAAQLEAILQQLHAAAFTKAG